jgi:plastocyanin
LAIEEHTPDAPSLEDELEKVASAEGKLESQFEKFRAATLLTAFLALVVAVAALVVGLSKTVGDTTVVQRSSAGPSTAAAAPVAAKTLDVTVAGGVKKGPDGKMHDAFSTTDFKVHVGQPLKLRITNKDDAPHSITSPQAGVNIIAAPGTHTYTLVVKQAGTFHWSCVLPCDSDANGWAMMHDGYMAGTITAS